MTRYKDLFESESNPVTDAMGMAHEVLDTHGYKDRYGHRVYHHDNKESVDHKQLHADLGSIGYQPVPKTAYEYRHSDGSTIGGHGDKGRNRNTQAPYEMIVTGPSRFA